MGRVYCLLPVQWSSFAVAPEIATGTDEFHG